jgi:hypothetical protein
VICLADISGLSGRLVQAAKQKGSSDNISVIVVFFREPELIARRPLPPAPTSVLEDNTPSMEQQQQQQTDGDQPHNPFDSSGSNPFGNGDELVPEGHHYYQGVDSPSEFDAANWQQHGEEAIGGSDSFNGDSAETPEVYDGSTAQWGWKDPEIEALEIEAGRDSSEHHFAATSVVPLPDPDIDLDVAVARDQYEKVAAKWGRELEQFDADDVVTLESKSVS